MLPSSASALPALCVILVLFSTAGLLLETAYRTNSQVEANFCRFQVCDTPRLIETARSRRLLLSPEAAALGLRESLEALRRDPAAAARWCDAGEALLLSGGRDRAAYAFRRAVELAPNSPPVLMQAANFFWRTDQPAAALPLDSRILRLIREYDPVVFLAYSRSGLTFDNLLRDGIPADAAAARSFFEYTLAPDSPPDETQVASLDTTAGAPAAVWRFLRLHHYDTPPLAARYLDFLLAHRLYLSAAAFWSDWGGPRPASNSNLLFNAGFESPFSGPRFDWTPSHAPHVSEARDSDARSGSWSLRLDFDGTENILYHGVSQTVIVSPGPFHFRAWFKLHELTTDRGLAFRIFDPESPSLLDVRTPMLTGTLDWTPVELAFTVRPGTHLIEVELFREPSWKFDNKFAGTAWVDALELTRVR
jgi:tetratricopeptide (TPR) repeat protein